MVSLSDAQIGQLYAQAMSDPQLPRADPTASFWQLPPHPTVSHIRSVELPSSADYVVIRSGVTGCSIAKTLLEHATGSVAVLEARTLTSGATGRNGGLLSNFVPSDYKKLCDRFGREQAVMIAKFAIGTLEKMHGLANETQELKEASQVRRLLDVTAFETSEDFNDAVESCRQYEEHVAEDEGNIEVLSPEDAASKYNIIAKAGAIVFHNGAFWPYRLVTKLWAQMLDGYAKRLSIETNTAVTKVILDASMDSHPYVLHTTRGIIRASKVIHATNGYAGHLIPSLRGKIYPLRGHMSTQTPPLNFGRHGHAISWSIADCPKYDEKTGIFEPGMYYSNQNAISGDVFIGGEKVPYDAIINSDDSSIAASCAENLSTLVSKHFLLGHADEKPTETSKVWSGIMGFTADTVPLVGRVPQAVTGRGKDEFIAAGFNGYGMPLCWSCGEAVAKMLLGLEVDFLPEVFLATEERLLNRMDTVEAIQKLVSW